MSEGTKPFFQKFLESPFLLLIAGILVMFVFYTGWGVYELMTMPTATLP